MLSHHAARHRPGREAVGPGMPQSSRGADSHVTRSQGSGWHGGAGRRGPQAQVGRPFVCGAGGPCVVLHPCSEQPVPRVPEEQTPVRLGRSPAGRGRGDSLPSVRPLRFEI